ncbi:MAG: tetratricopeptide repeat protein [Phycisphaerae bacterium]|nr:tetratricopeptide repeat protein [Phycisphaerae bacterium]
MTRPAWIAPVLLIVVAAPAAEGPTSTPAIALRPEIRQALREARQAASVISRLQEEVTGAAGSGMARQTEELADLEKQMADACARITVDPRAEQAAAAMRRSEYASALPLLEQVLEAAPDDPYASYLAGMCEAEQGRFAEGGRHFARVLRREPDSHTARLLSRFCECAAKQERPISDERLLECYDEALADAQRHMPPPPAVDARDLGAAMVTAFRLPDVLRDPLIYKIDNEAAAGRGPVAVNVSRFVKVAEATDYTHPLFLAFLLAEDQKAEERLEERLGEAKHAITVEAILFLNQYYGPDKLYRRRSPAFQAELARLRHWMPDDGLWLMLSIPYAPPVGENRDHPPLTSAELELLKRAEASPRFTNHNHLAQVAAIRLFEKTGYPRAKQAGELLAGQVRSPLGAWRDVACRANALARQRFEAGEVDGGLEIARTLLTLTRRLEPAPDGVTFAGALVRASHERMIAQNVLENAPSLPTETCLEYQQLWLQARTVLARHEAVGAGSIALHLPLRIINNAEVRLRNGQWPPWAVRRAERQSRKPENIEGRRRLLTLQLEGERQPGDRDLLDPGILHQIELLPELRRFREAGLDDTKLWMLVWTLGELRDDESVEWLIAQLEDERGWLRAVAAEALTKITGRSAGRDPAAWREMLRKRP